jgi:hypothetical protein
MSYHGFGDLILHQALLPDAGDMLCKLDPTHPGCKTGTLAAIRKNGAFYVPNVTTSVIPVVTSADFTKACLDEGGKTAVVADGICCMRPNGEIQKLMHGGQRVKVPDCSAKVELKYTQEKVSLPLIAGLAAAVVLLSRF